MIKSVQATPSRDHPRQTLDPRVALAAERTLLARIRTGLAPIELAFAATQIAEQITKNAVSQSTLSR